MRYDKMHGPSGMHGLMAAKHKKDPCAVKILTNRHRVVRLFRKWSNMAVQDGEIRGTEQRG